MRRLSYNGKVSKEGETKLWNSDQLKKDLVQYYSGKKFTIILTEYKKPMTSKQHGYYRLCILPEVQTGYHNSGTRYTLEQIDAKLHRMFMTTEDIEETTGEVITIIESMEDMGTKRFNEIKEAIQQWSAEDLGHYIPDPGENKKMDI